ncbi:FUSC family protein [Corynebacterium coyleae]|uniref:FUSC family protein n=1 Tax=uncultured Corynebacterium sp. TaxID=159447 RepID=UPI0028891FD5|nr:FUSC family protein [uncultured Corynebacterium sp.]
MGPARRDHIPAFRTALGVAIPMFTLLALGRLDLAIYANFGAFTGVYGRHATSEVRLKHHILAGTALTLMVTLGATIAWFDLSPWVLLIVTSIASSVWATIALATDMKPTGSVFVIFAVAAVGSLSNPVHPLLAFAIAGGAALVCLVLGLFSHLIGEGPGGDAKESEIPTRSPDAGRVPRRRLAVEANRFFFAPLLAGTLGLISVTLVDPLSHSYWAMVAAAAPLVNSRFKVQYFRAIERVLGTLTGIAVTGFLLSHHPQGWQIVVWIVVLQYLTEMYVTRNYTIAASFITPTALLMVQAVDAAPVGPMLLARTAETMLGAVAALAIIAVGYVRKYPTVVLPRRGDDPY